MAIPGWGWELNNFVLLEPSPAASVNRAVSWLRDEGSGGMGGYFSFTSQTGHCDEPWAKNYVR